jgi:hypothetical protein
MNKLGPLFNMTKKDPLDSYIHLPAPDDSVEFFREVKRLSEEYWRETEINKSLYGFQVQKNSIWKSGLTEDQLRSFEHELNLVFPEALRNLYRVMNGLSKPGINVFGADGTSYGYSPIYYSYPDDLPIIQDQIQWVLDSNEVNKEKLVADFLANVKHYKKQSKRQAK